MPRQLRIEYAGAVYHVMARGDRREEIVRDEEDRVAFERVWAEVVGKTGWKVLAWALMGNHYHAVLRTPEANLVDGMRWVQNTWTRRFNVRHRLWGHVFGGRYKSVVCQEGDYLRHLINYVHLNPVRAGLIAQEAELEQWRWSSLRDYCLPMRKCRSWVAVASGLAEFGFSDNAKGRHAYLERLNTNIDWQEPRSAGLQPLGGQKLEMNLRRSWCLGSEEFREKLLSMLGSQPDAAPCKPASGYTAADARDLAHRRAREMIALSLDQLGLRPEDLPALPKCDSRKVLIAALLRQTSTVPLAWIADELSMGHPAKISHLVSRHNQDPTAQKRLAKIKKTAAEVKIV